MIPGCDALCPCVDHRGYSLAWGEQLTNGVMEVDEALHLVNACGIAVRLAVVPAQPVTAGFPLVPCPHQDRRPLMQRASSEVCVHSRPPSYAIVRIV